MHQHSNSQHIETGSLSGFVRVAVVPSMKLPLRSKSIVFHDTDTSPEDRGEVVEVIEQDITEPTLKVGSGYEWKGKGAEPQWNNPQSTKAYDHIKRHHGPQLKPLQFRGRIAKTNNNQGQWLNVDDWVKAEQLTPKHPGRYIIDFKRPIGRVYHPDGTITENVTRAFIQRNYDGTLNSGYPVTNSFTLF